MSNRTEAARRKLTESHRETTATAPVLDSTLSEWAAPVRTVGNAEVIHFIRHAARWRRFFRCSLAASNFRSRSA